MDNLCLRGHWNRRMDISERGLLMNTFLTSNDTKYRLLRTIVQGLIGVLIANIDVLVGLTPINPDLKPIIVAVVMAILSPIMAELGGRVND